MTTKHNKASQFYDAIDQMIGGGSTVLEAVVEYCYKHNLEVEAVVPLVTRNSNLVSKLREEAEATNSIEKVAHLPI
jgi:hypothetical protein